jgi:hypothetical protein
MRNYVGLDYCWFWFWLSVVGRTRNKWNWILVPRFLVVTALLSIFLCHYEIGMRQAVSPVRQDVYLLRVRTIHRFGMGQSALLLRWIWYAKNWNWIIYIILYLQQIKVLLETSQPSLPTAKSHHRETSHGIRNTSMGDARQLIVALYRWYEYSV